MLKNLNPKKRREVVTLATVFVAVLLVSAFAVYFMAARTSQTTAQRETGQQTQGQASPEPMTGERRAAPELDASDDNLFERMFGTPPISEARARGGSWTEVVATLTLRLLLAALLGAVLAFRPRRRLLILKPNPYVAQTQILLAVVASALMIIVGDNAARAFGIFAAVSLVRFRTNIRDPKEITVLLISLAIGLATGVGRWDLAVVLAVFSLILLWILEYREAEQIFRSMDLKVSTRNVEDTQGILREVLERHSFDSELRVINQPDGDDPLGSLTYTIDVSPTVSTDQLSEEILARDSQHIDSIEWEQKKSFSYFYQ